MKKGQKRVLSKKRIEEIAKEKGYIDLEWLSSPISPSGCLKKTRETYYSYDYEKTKYVLYGRPVDYNGIYEDYNEPIFAQVVNGSKTRGYRRVTSTSFGLFAHEWIWDENSN